MTQSGPEPTDRAPRWRAFDADWYRARYPDLPAQMRAWEADAASEAASGKERAQSDITRDIANDAALERFYREAGCRYGHSPNRYFDEVWYCETYPDVRKGIISGAWPSGFAHYCQKGFLTRSPHWLFDEAAYRRNVPELTATALKAAGFQNGYDHYLEKGEAQGRAPSPMVDLRQAQRMAARYPEWFGEEGVLASWLVLPAEIADAAPLSWYFDPVWYLERYPQIKRAIEAGLYTSALHHYLTNETPRQFDPSPWFSENWYLDHAPDLKAAVDSGAFRNGFAHFIRFGAQEGRQPAENVDLARYATSPLVRSQCASGSWVSPFARYAAERAGVAAASGALAPEISEAQARKLFKRRAEGQMCLTAREKLDFSFQGLPEVSVLMVLHGKIELTLQTLASLRSHFGGAIELILVDSGSRDETREIERVVEGATILRYSWNIGYLDGCNVALKKARAPFVLYLNNDIRLYPGALDNALARLRAQPSAGAVTAKIVRSNMRLQEAGSIIWRNGGTYGYRREDDPNLPEANFARSVDFGSAAFLLARTGLLRRLGGYDRRYRPAYFEDTDLCVRLRELGADIAYEPCSVVEHLEYGTSGTSGSHAQIQRNFKAFSRAHADFLRNQQPPHVRNALLGRERGGKGKRVLFIEDRLPLPELGSGYVRSNDIVRVLAELGWRVTVFPMHRPPEPAWRYYGAFPETVELALDQDASTLLRFLEERAAYYDLLWVGRTHNMARVLPVLSEAGRFLPNCPAILDTEVVAAPRTLLQRRYLPKSAQKIGVSEGISESVYEKTAGLEEMVRDELACASYCQRVVAVTEADAALVRQGGHDNVSVLGHAVQIRPTPKPFADRKDLLFVGALHSEDAPNYDSLLWFARDVLPKLEGAASKARLRVAGYVAPGVDMTALTDLPGVDFLGPIADLEPLYDSHRVFVAPTRFAGGLPFKVHEAASYGLPMVVTTLLREQVGWKEGEALLSASADAPLAFAQAVTRLYEDEKLWEHLRAGALDAVRRDASAEAFRAKLAEILATHATQA